MEKVIYKTPNNPSQHMPDVFIMCEPGMANKYRASKAHRTDSKSDSDGSVPLVNVVQAFEIYQTETGRGFEGRVVRPSKADLDSIFGTEDEQKIVEKIILEGDIQGARV